jgi:hypothetical protein
MVATVDNDHEIARETNERRRLSAEQQDEADDARWRQGSRPDPCAPVCATCEGKGYYLRGECTYQVCSCNVHRRFRPEAHERLRARQR